MNDIKIGAIDSPALKAKKILFGLFVGHILVEAVIVASLDRVPGLVRMILTLLLMYQVFQGKLWAQRLMAGLSFVSAMFLFKSGADEFQNTITIFASIIALGCFFLTISLYMLMSKDLRRYFEWKRSRPR